VDCLEWGRGGRDEVAHPDRQLESGVDIAAYFTASTGGLGGSFILALYFSESGDGVSRWYRMNLSCKGIIG